MLGHFIVNYFFIYVINTQLSLTAKIGKQRKKVLKDRFIITVKLQFAILDFFKL